MQHENEGLVRRVLRRAGYVPAARLHDVTERLQRAELRIAGLERELDGALGQVRASRDKARENARRSEESRAGLEERHAQRLAAIEGKVRREAERLRAHDTRRSARLDDLRDRMTWAEKATTLGREHLMAIEVKLDIVEGAIKVLDQRTRAALAAARGGRDAGRGTGRLT